MRSRQSRAGALSVWCRTDLTRRVGYLDSLSFIEPDVVMNHPLAAATPPPVDHADSVAHDIATIRARIRDAEKARDAWRAAGREEKYLEAYVTVEALLLQMEARARESSTRAPPG